MTEREQRAAACSVTLQTPRVSCCRTVQQRKLLSSTLVHILGTLVHILGILAGGCSRQHSYTHLQCLRHSYTHLQCLQHSYTHLQHLHASTLMSHHSYTHSQYLHEDDMQRDCSPVIQVLWSHVPLFALISCPVSLSHHILFPSPRIWSRPRPPLWSIFP